MNSKTMAIFLLLFALPLVQSADAQIPPPSPAGCPGQYLFNDGVYWAYENVICATSISGCNATYFNPMQILIFDKLLGDTNPPCKQNAGTGLCECTDKTVPVGAGGAGPLRYKPNGKKPTEFNGAADAGPDVINTKEFVGKFSKDLDGNGTIDPAETYWYKFIQGDVDRGGGTPVSFYYCYKINPGDSPVKKADAGGGDFTPDEWFVKNADGTDIKVDEIVGSPKRVTVRIDGNPTTYRTLYAPAKKAPNKKTEMEPAKSATPTPIPDGQN